MGLNHDKLKQRRSGARAGFGWRPKEGENRIRVLPPHSRFLNDWDSLEDVAISHRLHYFRIEGRPTEVSLCLEENKGRCPACEAWRTWRKSDDPGMKELARQISPGEQYLMNILDINNPQTGVQHWGANYTCWDKILEIVANPAWGNVLSLNEGVDFVITMTPGSKSRSGFNSYSIMPVPTRTSVLDILAQDAEWRTKMDALSEQGNEPKEPEEMYKLLEEMGFPPPKGRVVSSPVAPPPPPPPAPTPSSPPPPPPPAAAAPVPTPTPAVTPPAAEMSASGAHYDPGPDYVNSKVAADQIPAGAPRCFGDYNPKVHRCQPCPSMAACQMKLLGI